MWRWLQSWFVSRPDSIWQPKERLLYAYFNGEKIVREDPLILFQRLMETWTVLQSDMNAAAANSKFAEKAEQEVIRQISGIFALPVGIAAGGLTITELQELLDDFILYFDTVKKNLRPLRTASKSSAMPVFSVGGDSVIGNTSDSSSTSGNASTSEPASSPMAPP